MDDIRRHCSLDDRHFDARRRELREGLLRRVRGRIVLDDGVRLRFDASPERRDELEAFAAFERECCPGIAVEILEAPAAGALQLEIRGFDPETSGLAQLASAPDASCDPRGRRGLARALRALGFGSAISLVVCCAVPAVVAAIGGAIAAPLAALDRPLTIALSSLAFAAYWWRRETQPGRSKNAIGRSCGC